MEIKITTTIFICKCMSKKQISTPQELTLNPTEQSTEEAIAYHQQSTRIGVRAVRGVRVAGAARARTVISRRSEQRRLPVNRVGRNIGVHRVARICRVGHGPGRYFLFFLEEGRSKKKRKRERKKERKEQRKEEGKQKEKKKLHG
jgi:hypothetical protein